MKVREIPKEERPREKLVKLGSENVSTSELLAILLGSGTKEKNVVELSFELLSKVERLSNLSSICLEELCSIKGIGEAKFDKIKELVTV